MTASASSAHHATCCTSSSRWSLPGCAVSKLVMHLDLCLLPLRNMNRVPGAKCVIFLCHQLPYVCHSDTFRT